MRILITGQQDTYKSWDEKKITQECTQLMNVKSTKYNLIICSSCNISKEVQKKFIYIGNNSKLKISNLFTHKVSIYLQKTRFLFTSKIN